jgi:hypothetical protein
VTSAEGYSYFLFVVSHGCWRHVKDNIFYVTSAYLRNYESKIPGGKGGRFLTSTDVISSKLAKVAISNEEVPGSTPGRSYFYFSSNPEVGQKIAFAASCLAILPHSLKKYKECCH